MSDEYTTKMAANYLDSNNGVRTKILCAMSDSGIPDRHRMSAKKCGAFLYESGWMESISPAICGYTTKEELVELNANHAFNRLRSVGLIKTGMFGTGFLVSAFLRYIFIPYLSYLIKRKLGWS